MSLFSGYHLIGSNNPEPAEPAPAPRNAPDLPEMPRSTVIAVQAPGAQEQWKLLRSQLESTLAEQSLQLDAERANGRRTRTALYALAGHLCKRELEKKRRQLGDRKLWDWSAEDWCAFLTEHAASPSEPRTPPEGSEISAAYARLQLEHAELRIEHVKRLEEVAHLKQALAARRTADETVPLAARGSDPNHDDPPSEAAAAEDISAEAPGSNAQSRVDDLVRLMATTGLARVGVLRERLAETWGHDPKSGTSQRTLKAALEAGLIQEQVIQSDWRGAPKSAVVTLTREGRTRAVTVLGAALVAGELEPGQARGYSVELSVLVLKAAELLREAGYRQVQAFPIEVVLADGRPYYPPISAVETSGEIVFIECERERSAGNDNERWLRAAQAGGGEVRLITTTAQAQEGLVSEINTAKLVRGFRLRAANVSDISQGKRGRDGSIWTYQNAPGGDR